LLGNVAPTDEIVVADLEAGIGTMTRMSEKGVEAVLVVVEATPKSLEVGARAAALAEEKSLGRVIVVANRVRGEDDLEVIRSVFPSQEVVSVPDDPAIVAADRAGVAPLDASPDAPAVRVLVGLGERLLELA
jgi:CO dehydrogenase maturation factor